MVADDSTGDSGSYRASLTWWVDSMSGFIQHTADIKFRLFWFVEHSAPKGALPNVKEAQACWYYVMCAHKNLAEHTEGAVYEGELDPLNNITNILVSICFQYGVDDPDDVLKHMGACIKEAARCNFEWDSRVERPRRDMFNKKVMTILKPN